MAPTTLLGPPEIRRPKSVVVSSETAAETSSISNRFMDLMAANFNSTKPIQTPPMGYTENLSATFLATGNPCLDFFFHVVPDTPAATLTERLRLAWEHNALTTLKLICNLRGVRGTGKSDKEGYYTAALWLHNNHPKTFACNVGSIAEFGYFKDLPEILFRLLEGGDVRKKLKQEFLARSKKSGSGVGGIRIRGRGRGRGRIGYDLYGRQKIRKRNVRSKGRRDSREARVLAEMKRAEIEKLNARAEREEKKIAMAKKAFERYTRDPEYRFLYERVSDHFSELLKKDLKYLREGEEKNISLAAKWCPSIDSSFDKSTLLCESIARKVFDRESYPEYNGVEEAHYAYRVRDRLRKEVLVPLRKALELPEVYIGANDWGSIPYNRVPSVAMKFYKEKFLKHDKERFEEYLQKVKKGEAKIAAGALLPHEIIAALSDYRNNDNGEVAELQWKRMVSDLAEKGKMKNCLAICDVSGSMNGTPMEVSVALGVLVSELSEEPWKGKLITFSANPKLQMVNGDDLRSKVNFVRRMEWGMNTDFQKVFDLILRVAVEGKLSEEDMIKRVLVFSDMEFDQASKNPWETDYKAIVRKYEEKGYGSSVPEIVFWNLRDSKATPVPANQPGVALVSGFSKNLMKLFLEDKGGLNPESVMEAAISGDEYKKLVVLD